MRRLLRAGLAGVALVVALAGCADVAYASTPTRPSGDPAVAAFLQALWDAQHPWTYADTYAAVDLYFGPYGLGIVTCVNRILDKESGHWPYSNNGNHFGAGQLHGGFWGSIQAAAAERGEEPDFFNPYQNVWAMRAGFDAAGRSFRANWAGTRPRGCP